MSLFLNRFTPDELKGSRGRQFDQRDDKFQQLVGDATLEQLRGSGLMVNVAPTKGNDGSIDVFIESPANPNATFAPFNLPLPLIIECKDHDDSLTKFSENVSTGWQRVKQKLREHADTGWTGNFSPWKRARSYLYCISGVLPNQDAHDKLSKTIRGFFLDELEDDTRPPLEQIRVLDWTGLKSWLDSLPRVGDRWLGISLPSVLGHDEFVARLGDFRRYLLESQLPFVPPPNDDQAHPDRIWQCLRDKSIALPGIILVGAGGVGKTRTALEIANRANADGWRVLHVIHGEPAVTVDTLTEPVLDGDCPTLLVFDYLDQMNKLDLAVLNGQLLAEARSRNKRVALLATSRPIYIRSVKQVL